MLTVLLGLFWACGEPERESPAMGSSLGLRNALNPRPWTLVDGDAGGRTWVEPHRLVAAEVVTLEVYYKVGPEGITPGGGLLIELPKTWMSLGPPLAKPVQFDDPSGPHHVGVTSTRSGTRVTVTSDREGLGGVFERFPRTLTVLVGGAALKEDDFLTVTFGPTSAPLLAGPGEVRVGVDAFGLGEYRWVPDGGEYEVRSGPVSRCV